MIDFIRNAFPEDTLPRLICCGVLQLVAYYVPKHIKRESRSIMVTRPDRMIKARPWWVFIYVLSYAQWLLCYWAVFRSGSGDALLAADITGKLVCMLFFIILPTTMEREEPSGPCAWALRIIYRLDAPTNLFPSMHSSLSMICLIMLFTCTGLPLWLKIANAVFSVCVFVSTLKTKQHVIVDTLAGMLLGALCCLSFLLVF